MPPEIKDLATLFLEAGQPDPQHSLCMVKPRRKGLRRRKRLLPDL